MSTHTEIATPSEKSERAPVAPPVVASGELSEGRLCPICERPLTGRQRSACSDRCRAALSRRRRAKELAERNVRLQGLVKLLAKEAGLRVEDFA